MSTASRARPIIDLAAILSDEALGVAFESARKRRLVTVARLEARATELCGPGRTGSAAVRRLLALQQPGEAALESPLEVRVWRMLRASGLPLPERQHWVRIAGRRFRLDFA